MSSSKIRYVFYDSPALQNGLGVPDHIGPLGSLYVDYNDGTLYINKDGISLWNEILDSTYIFTGGTSTFTGGTVSGATYFLNGLTANTISATTYYNLPSTSGLYLPLSGGTVSGPTIFTSGITANTISDVDYINFKTSPTVPNPTGGTLYFDSAENALSYKPVTNQNDVTVNLGQEGLIRIYNNLGYQINNGQVLHITGATLGIPTVALANASKLGTAFTESIAQTSGVATHDIPNGQFGFMTNFGIVRDLNTSAFTVGQEVFLSDTVDGALTNDPNNIAFTSRISTVGYCLESSPTNGKILVVITNENPLQSLTQQEINVLLGNIISTGAYFYTGTTTASTTTINVSPVRGWIVYNTGINATNPLVLNVYYSGGTNLPITGLTTSFDTYLLVNSGGTLYQTTSYPTPIERRQNIFLGRIVHPNKTTILNVEQSVDFGVSPYSSLRDFWVPIKLINENVVPSPNGATLTFKTSSGTFWGNGIGFATNELNPNSITVPAYTPASFYYTTQTGGTFTSTTTTVDATKYDVGGVVTNVPGSGNYTTQRIYMSQSGVIRIQYGQTTYPTLAKAIAAIPSESFVTNPDNALDGILIGLLTVKDGTGDLSNTDDAIFTFVSKFGDLLGGTGGIATTTLQQAYNNSVPPEILTNSTLGAMSIQNGTGSADNVSNIFEGLNTAGSITSFIRADGSISGVTLQTNGFRANNNGLTATTISATTYVNLPISGFVSGTGTTGTYPVFISGATIGNSRLVDGANGGIYTLGSQWINLINGGSVLTLNRSQSSMNFGLGVLGSVPTVITSSQAQEGLHITSVGDFVLKAGNPLAIVYNVNRANRNIHIGASGDTDYATQKLQVTGGLRVTEGLTATTISATTYVNLPTDIIVTGGTYSTGGTATFTNNTGGTFSVTGFNSTNYWAATGTSIYNHNSNKVIVGNSVDTTPFNQNKLVVDGDLSITSSFRTSSNSGRYAFSDGASGMYSTSGSDVKFRSYTDNDNLFEFVPIYPNSVRTGTTQNVIHQRYTINPISGGSIVRMINLEPTVNQTGSTPSIIHGIRIAPTLTNAFDFRAIEVTSGSTFLQSLRTTNLTANTLTVTGNTNIRAFSATSGTISGSGQNILTVVGSGSSTTSPIFSVLGSNGELFSVTDSLTGSLFSVNDISGLPIVEVFSDSTILMGNYLAPSLNTTARINLTAGTNTIYSIPTSAYTGAFVDYTVINTGNTSARCGNIMTIWTTGSTEFTDVSTNDIGSTSGITFSSVLSGTSALIRASATTTGWTLKTIIRAI